MYGHRYYGSRYYAARYFGGAAGAAAVAGVFEDLTTAVVGYLPTLRGAQTTPQIDSTTAFTTQVAAWRNADLTFQDTNTIIARALS